MGNFKMHRLMYKTWRRQCVGPCALIMCVWYLTAITFPDPRSRNRETIVPKHRRSLQETNTRQTHGNITTPHGAIQQVPQYINPHDFKYIINNPLVCNVSQVFVLLFVHSSPDHFQNRKLIRSSWASVKSHDNKTIRTIFLLGKTKNLDTQLIINQESMNHKDIIQEDFLDQYRNLTYKHIMGLKWISTFCSQAQTVVKVDDDTFVHIFRLVKFLTEDEYFSAQNSFSLENNNTKSGALSSKKNDVKSPPNSNNDVDDAVYCSVFRNYSPRRDKSDKWYVTRDEYAADKYPPYCEGFAYIIKTHLVKKLYEISLQTKYYWIDDVYVTGILAEKLGIKPTQFRHSYGASTIKKSQPPHDFSLFLLDKYPRNSTRWMEIWNTTRQMYLGP